MTPAWKESVKVALKNNKLAGRKPSNQKELADAIHVHKTAITKMFEAQSSALVDRICRVLPVAQPMRATDTDANEDIAAELAELGPEDKEVVRSLMRRLRKPRRE